MSAGVVNGLIDEGALETVVLAAEPVARPPDPEFAVPEFSDAQAKAADQLRSNVANGGFSVSIGWLVGGFFALVVAASVGQIASAYPTAGSLYHWSSILGGKFWGWLTAWLNLLGTEPAGLDAARAAWKAAAPMCKTAREKGHHAAVGQLIEGRWHDAAQTLLRLSADHPHDLLALQVGHQIDFFTGNARLLRDRIARAVAEWSPGMPGYHALLGMQAFGLEEMGDYAYGEIIGRKAVDLEPRDSWAQHAVAHVLAPHEDRRAHEEGERVVLEGAAVAVAHEVVDEPGGALGVSVDVIE